jgi:hypothetical protein
MSTTSVATPLMKRTACRNCGHLHRAILGLPQRDSSGRKQPAKCDCCGTDCKENGVTEP